MKLPVKPNEKFLSKIFDIFVDNHCTALFFFSNPENLKLKETFSYAQKAVDYVFTNKFTYDEIYGDGDISIFYATLKDYENVSINFLDKILKNTFDTTFKDAVEITRIKSKLPVMYKIGENPFDINKDVYVYKSLLHKVVMDFVIYYIYSVGMPEHSLVGDK